MTSAKTFLVFKNILSNKIIYYEVYRNKAPLGALINLSPFYNLGYVYFNPKVSRSVKYLTSFTIVLALAGTSS